MWNWIGLFLLLPSNYQHNFTQTTHTLLHEKLQIYNFSLTPPKSIFFSRVHSGDGGRMQNEKLSTSSPDDVVYWILHREYATNALRTSPSGEIFFHLFLACNTRFFLNRFSTLSLEIWVILSGGLVGSRSLQLLVVTFSPSWPSFHSQKSTRKFLFCSRRRHEGKSSFRSRPLRAVSNLQRQSLAHAVLIAFPTFERGKTKNCPSCEKNLNLLCFLQEFRENLNEHHFDSRV